MASPMIPYTLEYLFTAEAKNGNIIKQHSDDVSRIDPTRSAFYDVLQNLPLKTFSLVGKGHVFTVDFEKFQIRINGGVNQCPYPPAGSRVTPIYYRDVIQIGENQTQIEKTLISHLFKFHTQTKHINSIVRYRIGFQIHVPFGKNRKFEITIE
ncbi:MAG TPA: hypothetical protein VH186_06280 [Chloroflexia bacterium]|nr:hypothetical protein [Chloroflexia bacterium]